MPERCAVVATEVLALCLLLSPAGAHGNQGPLRSWAIDLNDPSEPDRWSLYPPGASSELIRWELVPRSEGASPYERALRFSATSELGVETHHVVMRPFPPEFQPGTESDIVLDWEWMIDDTELSDGVGFGLLVEDVDARIGFSCEGVVSHSRFTSDWTILFEPARKWRRHRFGFSGRSCAGVSAQPLRRIGIIMEFVNPVRQSVSIGELRVSEWPAGRLPPDPLRLPHRAPPPEEPFQAAPLDRLRRATAGALEDLDGDSLPELLVLERRGYAHLYRGDLAAAYSEELTEGAGLAGIATLGTGSLFLDLDADRDPDLVITSEFDVPRLFENRGDLKFRKRTLVSDRYLSFWYGAVADDVDRDGNTDLLFFSPLEEFFLFVRNRGSWRLEPEQLFEPTDLVEGGRATFTAAFADFDEDTWPDLFLGREHLLRNLGGNLVMVRSPWPDRSSAKTEGGIWADFNGDGHLDLLVLRDATESTTYPGADARGDTRLFFGNGAGGFRETGAESGLPVLVSAEVALAEDFDNDADLDLYLCQRDRPNYLVLNDGRGHFIDATERSGFTDAGGCDAAMAADVDGDSGMDVVILSYGSHPRVLLNQLARGGWIGVVASGSKPATDAIGARVRLLEPDNGQPIAVRWSRRGRGFGSVGPVEIRFGVGDRTEVGLEVQYPSGRTRRLPGVQVGRTILVREDDTGRVAGLAARLAEARFSLSRWFRRHLLWKRSVAWIIAGLAAVAGAAMLTLPGARWLAAAILVLGAGVAMAAGSAPGCGVRGSPPVLWLGGAVAGTLAPLVLRGARRLRHGFRPSPTSIEELIRFTLDFRHGGVETRSLLAVEIQAKNLFNEGELRHEFYSELCDLARRYADTTGARLRELVDLVRSSFPQLAQASALDRASSRLETVCAELMRLEAGEEPALADWSEEATSAARETRLAVEALLDEVDLRASSNVGEVIEEASALEAGARERMGVRLAVHIDPSGPLLGLIPRSHLLLVLGNLFAGSLAALEGSAQREIEITCKREHRKITIRFQDSGPGVPLELREEIFRPGFTTRPEGTGYGLARSRELLAHFGGSIALVESAEGAAFLLTLHAVHTPRNRS